MKPNELRIGNLIKIDGIVSTVDARTIFDFESECRVKEPIYLTEEWLVRFGYVLDSFYKTYSKGDFCICIKNNEFNVMNDSCSDAGCYYLTTIEYVHQLQNLYYALTGTELEIKL